MAARTDKTQDPKLLAGLLLARRGTAYFERKLAELNDSEFGEPSLLSGWDRRHVIAHVGYNARALTRLTEWAASGVENAMYPSKDARNAEIEYGASLSPAALRNLSAHAAVHLNVEWRDLEPDEWKTEVRTSQGRAVPASETVWMRTREVWLHAVDLDNGGSFTDFPPSLIDRLLTDVLGAWSRRQETENIPNFVLHADDHANAYAVSEGPGVELRGTGAALARWATGRGIQGVEVAEGGPIPTSPRWL